MVDVMWLALRLLLFVTIPATLFVLAAERFGYVRTVCVAIAIVSLAVVSIIAFVIFNGGFYAVGP